MTVSRVLRNSPRVSEETRRRVQEAIRLTGYNPDPLVAQLMKRVRQQRHSGERETIAFIYDHPIEDSDLHNYVLLEYVRERAAGHGYRVEPFHLGNKGLGLTRLQNILKVRGIHGALLSVGANASLSSRLDYSSLASVTFGFGLSEPSLHRASTNITEGLLDIFQTLQLRGYRRIGIAITPWIDFRAGHTYSGALLHYQQSLPPAQRVPMLMIADGAPKKGFGDFSRWIKKHRPDVLISMQQPTLQWLSQLNLQIPENIGFITHDWLPSMQSTAGMDHRRSEVTSAAIDLLAAHLYHYEYGIPKIPRQVLIPPAFVDGDTLKSG